MKIIFEYISKHAKDKKCINCDYKNKLLWAK